MKFLFVVSSLLCHTLASDLSPAEIRDQQEGLSRWSEYADKATTIPPSEAILGLGEGLRKTSRSSQYSIQGVSKTREKLRLTLLSIPGHAEYYRDKILSSQETYKQKRDGPTCHEYLTQQRYGFETLEHLPSPETVRVLGEMISNDWAPPGNDTAETSERLPVLSLRSIVTLSRLPIKDKPFNQPGTVENRQERIEAWRTWYEQIKEGKRTFRFEGDPTEYNLTGPAPKEKLARIALDRKRDEERLARHHPGSRQPENLAEKTAAVVSKPGNLAVILSSLLVLAAAIWYGIKRKRAGV